MHPPSKALVATAPNGVSDPGAGNEKRRHRNIAAAWLLVVAGLVQCGGVGVTMKIDESLANVWLPLAFCVPPLASVASLVLGDRRKGWVKLNYLFLGWWVLVGVCALLFTFLGRHG